MERTKINQLKNKIGKIVLIKGFVHEIRDQSKIKFILLRDNSGIMQVVISSDNAMFDKITKIPKESVLSIEGTVKVEKQAPSGIEIQFLSCQILSVAETPLPIQVAQKGEEPSLNIRLDNRWLDLRKPKNLLIFKIWTCMEQAMREWWKQEGFIQIYSPKLMGAPSESGAELFSINYFGKTAYLAQSPQFYKQMAMSAGFEKIFEIGPVFRANKSHTTRHDTEFTMIDMELSFIESHEDIMNAEERWLAFTIEKVKEKFGKEIKEMFEIDITIPKIPFPRITMKEAIHFLKEKKNHLIEEEGDLDTDGERLLFEIMKELHNHEFVFVTEYPWKIRPFYHMKLTENTTKSFDLLWRGLEITTGAQREHRHDRLKEQAMEKNLHLEPIKDYLNFFRYGCPPHGGFGLSPTRLLMILLGIKNVREVTFLPRDTERLSP